jgi:hypothetical protein
MNGEPHRCEKAPGPQTRDKDVEDFVPILAISSAFVRVDKHIQNLLPLQELQSRGETRK